jgi:hypothetical protein
MAQAGSWSRVKTAWITALCGLGHVFSSLVIAAVGIALGVSVTSLIALDSMRGNLAAWALIAFGLVYCVWGMRRAARQVRHHHWHAHGSEVVHRHEHAHDPDHRHIHEAQGATLLTPWILFAIFLFGPCEPLIPILMYPAAAFGLGATVLVAIIFSAVTIATMVGVVLLGTAWTKSLARWRVAAYSHAIAGATVLLCGVLIQFASL